MILSSLSYKGGVGKTTVAQNIAVCLAHSGYKVCILDADTSQNSQSWLGRRSDELPNIPVYGNTDPQAIMQNIKALYDDYEVIIIDSPPALSKIASKIILASHLLLIPITPTGGSDIWTTEQLLEHFDLIRDQKGSPIPAAFVVNRFRSNVKMHQAYLEALAEFKETYDVGTMNSKLADRSAYGEANLQGMGVYEYSNPQAKQEVVNLCNEIIALVS
ncbi:MAG: AAA family ATPase [Saprospiraceae bacterium]